MGRGSKNSMLRKDPCPMRLELYPYDFIYLKDSVSKCGPDGGFKYVFVGATHNSVHSSPYPSGPECPALWRPLPVRFFCLSLCRHP